MTSYLCIGSVCLALSSLACGQAATSGDRAFSKHEIGAPELMRKGEAAASIGDMTRAEQYFVMAGRAGADPHRVASKLLSVCIADQRYAVALEYAEQHLRRHPADVEIQFAAASLEAALGDLQRATRAIEEVVHARPQWAEAHYALASVLRQQGDEPDRANLHDLEYLKLSPEGEYAEAARDRLRRSIR